MAASTSPASSEERGGDGGAGVDAPRRGFRRHAAAADLVLVSADQRVEGPRSFAGSSTRTDSARSIRRPHGAGARLDDLAAADQHRLGYALVQHGLHGAQRALVLAFE
jgi:hypothetical protein